MRKENNNRRYPDGNHQPFHLSKIRQTEAIERQDEYNKLSIEEKLARLDEKFGKDQGAKKQRARLANQLEGHKQVPVEKKQHEPKQHQKAKDRRAKEQA